MNPELSDQALAALEADGPVLVLGGPGSGKTTLALLKAKQLVPLLRPGQEALFLSFSRAAVRQVLVRGKEILTRKERRLVAVKTYHSFCMDILKTHGKLLTGQPPRIVYPMEARLAKSAHGGDWEIERLRLAREDGRYCFEQFAPSAAEVLNRATRARELVSRRYPIVILDEFQDTDDSQWELVKLLSRNSLLIALADPDQRIFDYDPKVDPERLNHLRHFLSPSEFDLGSANHRSPNAGILSFADAVLRNTPLPQTKDVTMVAYPQDALPAGVHAHVIRLISQLRSGGIDWPTVAILCRTNSLVADVSSWLQEGRSFEGLRLAPVDHHVVWDADLTTAAAQVVASIMEWPQHELGPAVSATLRHLANYYDLKNAEHANTTARKVAVSYRAAESAVLDGRSLGLPEVDYLLSSFNDGVVLVGKLERDWYTARSILADGPSFGEVFESTRFVRLAHTQDEIGDVLAKQWLNSGTYGPAAALVRRALETRKLTSANSEPGGVILMTMHKAKGKEFDGVVLVEGAHKGVFFDSRDKQPHEASRRLLRVGITRARHQVCIVRPIEALPLTNG